jgi:hypothetical protein
MERRRLSRQDWLWRASVWVHLHGLGIILVWTGRKVSHFVLVLVLVLVIHYKRRKGHCVHTIIAI